MKVILFGATGMVGQGVLRECLLDPDVDSGARRSTRSPTGQQHAKLRELVHARLLDFAPDRSASSPATTPASSASASRRSGMNEADYHRVTYDFTLAAAADARRLNPGMTFVYVSGAGTDSTEQGRTMWARVKGKTENAMLALPFKATYMFRPGFIQPVHGEKSRTAWTRNTYLLAGWLYPLWKLLFPNHVTTTEGLARAMLSVAKRGSDKHVLEVVDINRVAAEAATIG